VNVIFDLDGTLALIEHRRHFVEGEKKDWRSFFAACVDDKPNETVVEILNLLEMDGLIIWILSGRSAEVLSETRSWLAENNIKYDHLIMRKEGDHQPDVTLKKAWLDEFFINENEPVFCVFDDRQCVVDMWREHGLTCLQVAPGNF